MLTKEERASIAERANKFTYRGSSIYEVLLGHDAPDNTTAEDDCRVMTARIIDLCDTSNMIELPRDKDGEVIHVGDTMYTSDGEKHKIAGYIMYENTTDIILGVNSEGTYITTPIDALTHKNTVTIASINKRLKHLLDKGEMSSWSMARLFDIADQLEKLGDDDD
nr:MAG TPA: hypothetical protein [Caudoviricetes sp.]